LPAKALSASVVVTWPALLLADELPADGALNGKADDLVTGVLVALVLAGLLAAGWLRPLWLVLVAVLVVGAGAPLLYESLRPDDCPAGAGAGGLDCLPVSLAAVYALPAVLVVLCGRLVRRAAGAPSVDVLPR